MEKEKNINSFELLEKNQLYRYFYPERLVQWETEKGGQVVLLAPKFRNRLAVRFLLSRMSRPWFRVHLDEMGSFVWLLCDGKHNIETIANKLSSRFENKNESAKERTMLFIRTLSKEKFIHLRKQDH